MPRASPSEMAALQQQFKRKLQQLEKKPLPVGQTGRRVKLKLFFRIPHPQDLIGDIGTYAHSLVAYPHEKGSTPRERRKLREPKKGDAFDGLSGAAGYLNFSILQDEQGPVLVFSNNQNRLSARSSLNDVSLWSVPAVTKIMRAAAVVGVQRSAFIHSSDYRFEFLKHQLNKISDKTLSLFYEHVPNLTGHGPVDGGQAVLRFRPSDEEKDEVEGRFFVADLSKLKRARGTKPAWAS